MPSSRLLSVGYYAELLHLRSQLLRQDGYIVHEAGDLHTAMTIARDLGSDLRLLLFCHSVPPEHQTEIMMELLERHSVPVLSICRLQHAERFPEAPVSVSPEDLLEQVRLALNERQNDGLGPNSRKRARIRRANLSGPRC
jgi:hypothetical protein